METWVGNGEVTNWVLKYWYMLWKNGNSGCICGGNDLFWKHTLSIVWAKDVDINMWEMINPAMNQTLTFLVHLVQSWYKNCISGTKS